MPSAGSIYTQVEAHEAHGLTYTGQPCAPYAALKLPVPKNVKMAAVVEPDEESGACRITLWEPGDHRSHYVVRTFGAGTDNPRTMGLIATRRSQGSRLAGKLEAFAAWVLCECGLRPAEPDYGCVLTRWSGRFPNPTTSVLEVQVFW